MARDLFRIVAGLTLILLLVKPVLVWGAPKPTSARPPAYRLAIFPWDLFDQAPTYSNIIITAMNDVLQAAGLFDVKFSYYRDQQTHPDFIRKLDKEHKRIWYKKGWFSPREPNVDGIAELAKDLNVDAVLLYYADVAFGFEAQDTLKAFLIDIHSRKVHKVTGYTGDFSLGEGRREITKMTNQIFTAYKLANPVDVIIVKRPQPQQTPAQLEKDSALAALERQKREKKQQAMQLADLKRQEDEKNRLAEAQRLADLKRQEDEKNRLAEAQRLADLKQQEDEKNRLAEAQRLADLKQQEDEKKLAAVERKRRQEKAAKLAELQRQEDRRQTLQATRDTVPPKITLTSHEIGQTSTTSATTSRLQVTGKVSDPSGVAEVTINGAVAQLDQNGNFATEVLLRIGENAVTVSAIDVYANSSQVQFLVQRKTSVIVASTPSNRTRQETVSAHDTTPPTILLTSHNLTRSARTLVSTSEVTLTGKALDDNGVVEVSVNGEIASLDREGNFSKNLFVQLGDNRIDLTAMDLYSNMGRLQFIIQRQSNNDAVAARTIKRYKVGQYYAMIVGNNDYKHLPKLETAVKDATELDTLLKTKYGFKTQLLLNATRHDMLSTLSQMRQTILPQDNLLIYYAGHGVFEEVAQEAYWLPVDAQEDNVSNWIISNDITSEMKRIPARHVLIVADSCYSGTLTRSADINLSSKRQGREYFLKKMFQRPSRTLMASGGNEPVVDSGSDGHSVFAYTFLRALAEIDDAVFTAEELFYNFVKQSVAGQAEQTPVYSIIRNSGHDGGDFVFIKR